MEAWENLCVVNPALCDIKAPARVLGFRADRLMAKLITIANDSLAIAEQSSARALANVREPCGTIAVSEHGRNLKIQQSVYCLLRLRTGQDVSSDDDVVQFEATTIVIQPRRRLTTRSKCSRCWPAVPYKLHLCQGYDICGSLRR